MNAIQPALPVRGRPPAHHRCVPPATEILCYDCASMVLLSKPIRMRCTRWPMLSDPMYGDRSLHRETRGTLSRMHSRGQYRTRCMRNWEFGPKIGLMSAYEPNDCRVSRPLDMECCRSAFPHASPGTFLHRPSCSALHPHVTTQVDSALLIPKLGEQIPIPSLKPTNMSRETDKLLFNSFKIVDAKLSRIK